MCLYWRCELWTYLKLLLEQIRCTKARPYIKQELQDHMEDQIAENMKAGMDHEQAEKEAVRDMGILWKQESPLTVSTDLRLHGNFWE